MPCLTDKIERFQEENARLQAELETASRRIKELALENAALSVELQSMRAEAAEKDLDTAEALLDMDYRQSLLEMGAN